jgi:hypothetical protein
VPTAIWAGITAIVLAAGWFVIRHWKGWGSPMIRPASERDADAPLPQTQAEASPG